MRPFINNPGIIEIPTFTRYCNECKILSEKEIEKIHLYNKVFRESRNWRREDLLTHLDNFTYYLKRHGEDKLSNANQRWRDYIYQKVKNGVYPSESLIHWVN